MTLMVTVTGPTSGRGLAHGPGAIAVLGTIAYHDTWHAAHQAASAAALRVLDEVADQPERGRTWRQIRPAVVDRVQADRNNGPFAPPACAPRGCVPFRRGGDLVAWLGFDGLPALMHRPAVGTSAGRSR